MDIDCHICRQAIKDGERVKGTMEGIFKAIPSERAWALYEDTFKIYLETLRHKECPYE